MRITQAKRALLRGLLAKATTPAGLTACKIAATRALPGLLDDLDEAERLVELITEAAHNGIAVMFSPLVSGEADWHGEWAIYLHLPDVTDRHPICIGPLTDMAVLVQQARAYLRERNRAPPATEGRA